MCSTVFAVAVLSSIAEAGRLWTKRAEKSKGSRHISDCGVKGASKLALDRDTNISIVNGAPATECEWRWQVGLRFTETGSIFCGGQLIHPEWVLTAAHCASHVNFNIIAGEYEPGARSGNEQHRWAVQLFRHPQWNPRTYDFDFSLVRVESPFEINDCIGTVCLPSEGNDVAPKTQCWITGFGLLAQSGAKPAVLQEAPVSILTQEDCRNSGHEASDITDRMICAQGQLPNNGGIIDACQGDSGGPLVCESSPGVWTVYGATSWGRGCAGPQHPGVWARIHESVSWIDETLEVNSGPAPVLPTCPDFARNTRPDSDGDCQCPWGQFCSTTNGSARDCPTSGPVGGYGGTYFVHECKNCRCFDN